jgi:Cu(I)/Ag(I) efflux system membrane fusion protein
MKRVVPLALVAAAVIAVVSFYVGRHTSDGPQAMAEAASAASSAGDRKVLYWHDPLVPGPRFDKPG